MMKTQPKIAQALQRVREIADRDHAHIVTTNDITRQDREILIHAGWLQEITKGWYMLTRPDLAAGDSAAWYANFWDFLRIYLGRRYGDDYCLSAEASLALHAGCTVLAQQIIVIASSGGTVLPLPFDSSIMTYADSENIPTSRVKVAGLQVMPRALALCKVAPTYFLHNSADVEIVLRSIEDSGELSRTLIENDFQRAASRIIGAYRFLKMPTVAQQIQDALSFAGIKVSIVNPFDTESSILTATTSRSPYATRIQLLWSKYREVVVKHFPVEPGLPSQPQAYLANVDELYELDAYNSLSIEGYQVTPELIRRVHNNEWNPTLYEQDAQQQNALAARGYFEAHQAVKKTLERIFLKESPGYCVKKDLQTWFQNLFAPSVRANIMPAVELAGYRCSQVFIRNSRHAPPPKEAMVDCMDAFFNCLQEETSAAVRAVLGHYLFVFIHPYMDGNGRLARFILNTMLASGGYPWTIVRVDNRSQYIDSLETTHLGDGIEKFCQFIVKEMQENSS